MRLVNWIATVGILAILPSATWAQCTEADKAAGIATRVARVETVLSLLATFDRNANARTFKPIVNGDFGVTGVGFHPMDLTAPQKKAFVRMVRATDVYETVGKRLSDEVIVTKKATVYVGFSASVSVMDPVANAGSLRVGMFDYGSGAVAPGATASKPRLVPAAKTLPDSKYAIPLFKRVEALLKRHPFPADAPVTEELFLRNVKVAYADLSPEQQFWIRRRVEAERDLGTAFRWERAYVNFSRTLVVKGVLPDDDSSFDYQIL